MREKTGKREQKIKMKSQMEQENERNEMKESKKTKYDNLRFIHQNTHNAA